VILGYVYFYLLAALSLAGALITVTNKNPIRCAMGLLLTIVSVAGLFLALHAEFLAFIQLIVYAGAIIVLFIFVIMLLGPSATAPRDHHGRIPRTIGLVASQASFDRIQRLDADFSTVDAIGRMLFSDGVVPFELSSGLLMVAIVGAVAVARGKQTHELKRPSASAPTAPGPSELEKHP